MANGFEANDKTVAATPVTTAFPGVVILKALSPLTTGRGAVVAVKVAPASINSSVFCPVVVPDATASATPVTCCKPG